MFALKIVKDLFIHLLFMKVCFFKFILKYFFKGMSLCTIHVPCTSGAPWTTIKSTLCKLTNFTVMAFQHGC